MSSDKNKTSSTLAAVAPKKLELYSPQYYGLCMLGGALACGPTHALVTPLDLVKCRRQVDPKIYTSNFHGWKTIYRGSGVPGVFFGWGPTLTGYAAQGIGKYGGYELFKRFYTTQFPNANINVVYLAASASAEFFADILLCPFEAVKVRMQTTLPPFAPNMRVGLAKIIKDEGFSGLYKGINPLWARQIPYTMIKFSTFENIVKLIYKQMPGKKEEYGSLVQTGVSFTGGYLAGIFCAVGSHPADVMVSKMNAERKAGEGFGACMSRIYGKIGFGGLWNGLTTRIFMVGTLTGLQWLIYDSFKVACGFPTTGGK